MNTDRFKFRVWDKKYKNYVVPSTVALLPSGVIAETDFAEGLFGTLPFSPDVSTELIIEQCTGLRDKNGRLIYEGDILKDSQGDDTLTIVYQNSAFGYVWAKQFHPMPEWMRDFVVIGNIHEPKWGIESEAKQ